MWTNDRQTGKGIFTFSNGEKYEGNQPEIKNEIILRLKNTLFLKGEFLDDEMHGFGIYTYSDSSRYEGKFTGHIWFLKITLYYF